MKNFKRIGVNFYLNNEEELNEFIMFKTLIKKDKKYFNMTNFFKIKIEEYLKEKR